MRQVVALRSDGREIDAATASAVELTGIAAYLDEPVEHLSTGQRRLVELARVLAGPFDTILLDEPSSGLDATETENFGGNPEEESRPKWDSACFSSSTTWPWSNRPASRSMCSTSAR